jgi:hypothetical protein
MASLKLYGNKLYSARPKTEENPWSTELDRKNLWRGDRVLRQESAAPHFVSEKSVPEHEGQMDKTSQNRW